MEIVVSGCVGALSAVSANLLVRAVDEGELEAWKSWFRGVAATALTEVRGGIAWLEQTAQSFGIMLPRLRARQVRAGEQLPEAFKTLAISLGSGLSLGQAIRYVGAHASEPVHTEFLRTASELQCGVSATEVLDRMVERLGVSELELVTLALKVSRRTGAPLAELLAEAAQLAGDRVELVRRLDVKTSQARMSAQLIACMPVGMIAFLSLLSGDFRAGVATAAGAASVAVALVLNVVAWVIIHRIMQVRF